MADYEPKSGWNLPPGCFEGDPRAPWNEPDPWVGRTCGECRHCKDVALLDGGRMSACAWDADDIGEIDPGQPAEECFEE